MKNLIPHTSHGPPPDGADGFGSRRCGRRRRRRPGGRGECRARKRGGQSLAVAEEECTASRRRRSRTGCSRSRARTRADRIALRLQAGHPGILEVDFGDDGSAEFSFERTEIAKIVVEAGNGGDAVRIDESNGVFADTIPTTIDGGNGNDRLVGGAGAGTLNGGNGDDTLFGGNGNETLLGGNGNDSIDGNRGNDVAFLGNGDDTFVWDPGDGSDTIEGQNGTDTMLFNGANVAEQVDLSANGNRLRFFRDIANITMDTDGVERVDFNALGGADVVTVNDLTGTDVDGAVNVDLAGSPRRRDGRRRGRQRHRQRHRRRRHDQGQRRCTVT